MNVPGTPSIVFLGYLLLFLPWAAFRSRRRVEAMKGAYTPRSREAIWIGTLISQGVLLTLAWLVGRGFDYEFFALPALTIRHVGIALLALAVCFGLRAISRAIRSADERKSMAVYAWAPRSPKEWTLWTAAVLLASVAEEVAYRGVGMSILWYTFGNPWVAVFLMAAAFALAHATQGWKSAAIIFAVALTMHALVALTETLILAMVVHAVYDFVTGYGIARTARLIDLTQRESRPSP